MLPVMVVGLFFKDEVEALFGEGPALVGAMLLLTAVLLLNTVKVLSTVAACTSTS